MMLKDDALLKRAVNGDQDALREVVERWMERIRRWAIVHTGEASSAEDGVQEALIRLVQGIHRYDPARPFGPWLKTLVTRACHTEQARRGRQVQREVQEPMEPKATQPAPGRQLDLRRAHAHAMDAFRKLTPRQREIIDLVDLQGNTPAEAASVLSLSQGGLRAQLFEARRVLRHHLVSHDIVQLLREA